MRFDVNRIEYRIRILIWQQLLLSPDNYCVRIRIRIRIRIRLLLSPDNCRVRILIRLHVMFLGEAQRKSYSHFSYFHFFSAFNPFHKWHRGLLLTIAQG